MIDFITLCEVGGHWCKVCEHFVEVTDSSSSLKCAECGSVRLKFCEPVPGFKREDAFKTDPKECHV